MLSLNKNSKIYVAGHTGLFGSAIVRALKKRGYSSILTCTHKELDLTDGGKTMDFFKRESPDYVFIAAAKVGGINANSKYMADFAMENLLITCNLIKAAHEFRVKKMLYLASSCIYPRESSQPIKENFLLTGLPEPTNEGYAIAKIAGVRLCEYFKRQYGDDFISCIPANVYGENDALSLTDSHVVPALLQKFHDAKKTGKDFVEIWGTGAAEREFLYIDDAAEACVFTMEKYSGFSPINIGTGETTSIKKLAEMIQELVRFNGFIKFDSTRPDGMPRRLLDSSTIVKMGWRPRTSLRQGLAKTYDWLLRNNYL